MCVPVYMCACVYMRVCMCVYVSVCVCACRNTHGVRDNLQKLMPSLHHVCSGDWTHIIRLGNKSFAS